MEGVEDLTDEDEPGSCSRQVCCHDCTDLSYRSDLASSRLLNRPLRRLARLRDSPSTCSRANSRSPYLLSLQHIVRRPARTFDRVASAQHAAHVEACSRTPAKRVAERSALCRRGERGRLADGFERRPSDRRRPRHTGCGYGGQRARNGQDAGEVGCEMAPAAPNVCRVVDVVVQYLSIVSVLLICQRTRSSRLSNSLRLLRFSRPDHPARLAQPRSFASPLLPRISIVLLDSVPPPPARTIASSG